MAWVFLSLLAAAFGGAATASNKYIFVRVSREPMTQIVSGGLVGAALSTVVTLIHGHGALSNFHALIGVIAGIFFGLALTTTLYAVKIGDVSQVGPLRFGAPVFVAILAAIFLDERLTAQAYIGILLIIVGAALLDNTKSIKIKLNSVLGLMILSGLAMATTQILTKYLLRFSDPYTILLYVRMGLLLFILPLLIRHFSQLRAVFTSHPWRKAGQLFIPGFFGTSSMFLLMFAAARGPVTLVSTIASATPFFIFLYVLILGRYMPDVYAERAKHVNLNRRIALSILMFAGVALIV